jgi:hypothetical protein
MSLNFLNPLFYQPERVLEEFIPNAELENQ